MGNKPVGFFHGQLSPALSALARLRPRVRAGCAGSEAGTTELSPGFCLRRAPPPPSRPGRVSRTPSPACPDQVLGFRGLTWTAGAPAACQNHFGSDRCSQVCPCIWGSGDTGWFPLIRAQTAVLAGAAGVGGLTSLPHRLIPSPLIVPA